MLELVILTQCLRVKDNVTFVMHKDKSLETKEILCYIF